MIYMSHLYML